MKPEADSVDSPVAALEQLFISHPVFDDIIDEIEDALGLNGHTKLPPCLQVTGVTGMGKTTLYETLEERYPPSEKLHAFALPNGRTGRARKRRLLCLEMPARPTVMSVARAMLRELGDPDYLHGRMDLVDARIDAYLRSCGTVGVVFDESNRAVDRNGALTAAALIDWIKTRNKVNCVSIIMIGLPQIRHLVNEDPQYGRRWDAELKMHPYPWGTDLPDGTRPSCRLPFLGLLAAFKQESPIPFSDDIDVQDDAMAKRFYYASKGVIGLLKKLLSKAMQLGRRTPGAKVDMRLLYLAYERAFGCPAGQGDINPFGEAWDGRLPIPPTEESIPAVKRRRSRASDRKRSLEQGLTKS